MFIPRTGIELPFIVDRPRFQMKQREFEPCHCSNPCLAEEYSRADAERQHDQHHQIVYDCFDPSPYYESAYDPYIDDADRIEIP